MSQILIPNNHEVHGSWTQTLATEALAADNFLRQYHKLDAELLDKFLLVDSWSPIFAVDIYYYLY